MLERLTEFVLRQRLLVMIATGMLVVAGIIAWRVLPIDAFPDVTNVQVMILTEAPGLAPEDVEQRITRPVELSMQGMPGILQLRSISKAGLSQVIIVFEDGTDIYFARQLAFQRLQAAKEQLPEWAEPEMGPISTGLGEIYQYTLESKERTPMELRTLQDWDVAPQLRAIAGVNEVNSFGGFVKQYHVLVRPESLRKYGLTLAEVLDSISKNNGNAGGDFITRGWEQSYVRSLGMIGGIHDIEQIVLTARDGTPVYMRDVADIEIGRQTRQGSVSRGGKGEAVAGMVIMLRGENSKTVVDRVRKAIPEIQASLPKDVRMVPFYDRTALIQACVKTVSQALMVGGILVIGVLFFFLWNLRAALVVALSLPLTMCVAFVLMGAQGVTANLMSLGGLAIAIGMVCDASIVVVENIMRHLAERKGSAVNRMVIISEAVKEVARPVAFAIMIIIVVFAPLFSLEQMEGKMFKPLALTMCFAMFGSLVVALTAIPVLGSLVIRGGVASEDHWTTRRLLQGYSSLLDRVLRRPRSVVASAAVILLVTLGMSAWIGTEFMPKLNEGAIAINVVRLPTASLEGSVAVGTLMEQQLIGLQEVETVVTKTGRAEISEDPMGPEQNDVFIVLRPEDQWTSGRSQAELIAEVQKRLSVVPGVRLSFSQPIALRVNELISGVKSDLAIKVFGSDMESMRGYANRVAVILQGLNGAEGVRVEQVSGFSQIEIVIDRQAAARHKINVADINSVVETAIGGATATTVIEGDRRFAVQVRFPEKDRRDIPALERILIPSPAGAAVPLGQLAKIREIESPAQISRENGMRRVVVECNIRGRDMGSFVVEAREKLSSLADELPAGYFLRYGGQFENQQRAMRRLGLVVPISIGLIFLMLYSALGTLRSSLMVLVNLPFAVVGGILMLVWLRIPLSVASAIGFISLFGMATQNGLLLVSFFNELIRLGRPPIDAVREGCRLRFRALMMTTGTTLLGLVPMVFASGSGSEMQRPLALVVLGGLVSAQALTLLVLPALYYVIETWNQGRDERRREVQYEVDTDVCPGTHGSTGLGRSAERTCAWGVGVSWPGVRSGVCQRGISRHRNITGLLQGRADRCALSGCRRAARGLGDPQIGTHR
jgi:cobalt-zinc-cadmium resistance protein CzcA